MRVFFRESTRGPMSGSTCLVSGSVCAPGKASIHGQNRDGEISGTTDARIPKHGPRRAHGSHRHESVLCSMNSPVQNAMSCCGNVKACRHLHRRDADGSTDPARCGTRAVDENPMVRMVRCGEIFITEFGRRAEGLTAVSFVVGFPHRAAGRRFRTWTMLFGEAHGSRRIEPK